MDDRRVRRVSASTSQNITLGVSSNMSLQPQSNITPNDSYANVFEKPVDRKNKRTQTDEELETISDKLERIKEYCENIQQYAENILKVQESIQKQ